jgi:hypothetical protein
MGMVCKKFKTTPKELAGMSIKQATNFLMDIVSSYEKENKAGGYIGSITRPLKNWFAFNDIHVQQKIRISGREELVTVADERPPTQEELRRIFDAGDLRAKTASALVAFSGVRLEVLGDYLGLDGLKIKDLPEMTISKRRVEFEQIPTIVQVRKTLSKTNKHYFSFLCREGCDYLKQYIEWRIRRGEKLDMNSPLITPSQTRLVGQHIRTPNISDLIRKSIRDAGFEWRPYVLRRYFDTRLMVAESDGLILRDWRQFFMGHSGDIEHTYTVNKALSKDVVEKMRASYGKASEKHLVTSRREDVTKNTIVEAFNRQFLTMGGYSESEISKVGDLSQLTPQQIQDLIQRKSMQALGLNGNGKQKIVPLSEVRTWVLEGWEFVSTLPTNEAVVRLPSPSYG